MAANNLRLGLQALDLLERDGSPAAERLRQQFCFPGLREKYSRVLDALYLPQPDRDGIIPQFDGYFSLKHIDLAPYRNAGDVGSIYLDYNQDQICTFQVHKQADTVALMLLLSDQFPAEIRKVNYEYYEARTLHDSSLSKSTHCVMAAEMGEDETAYRFFEGCAGIDFGPNMKTSDAGIHAAAMGGIWQCAVNGFGGARAAGEELHIDPRLPKAWHRLEFPLTWRGQELRVSVTKETVTVRNTGDRDVEPVIRGERIRIPAGGTAVR